jgi:ribosomal protein S18 acetylase RimI-like enzyme
METDNPDTKQRIDFHIVSGQMHLTTLIINEVSEWCDESGYPMWQKDDLKVSELFKGLSSENSYVGYLNERPAAAMILQWTDEKMWPGFREPAGYLHKLCVRRAYAGLGLSRKMIWSAMEICYENNLKYLRLDTYADSQKLCDLYYSLGFSNVGERLIGDRRYLLFEIRF